MPRDLMLKYSSAEIEEVRAYFLIKAQDREEDERQKAFDNRMGQRKTLGRKR